MIVIYIVCIITVIWAVINYENISYAEYYKRCVINSKHPDWEPWCGRNFFEEDPQWFIDNGYGDIIKKFYNKNSKG